jgi:ribose-phosphate pyrophosphokinase
MAVFSGNAHPKLAHDIARYLHLPLARAQVGRFSDGEINVEILENIRGRDTFIVQPTCPPTSENLMELLVMVDAARRASASRITAVIPYFGFARQDRRPRSARVPITSKLVAKLIGVAGVDRVLTVDLHADQIQGFFDIVVDNVYASPILLGEVWKQKYDDMVVDKANQSEVMNIIGEVEGKTCIMMDDMVDTAGTLCHAADALKENGASSVHAYITHPVLSGPAVSRISKSQLDELVVTDTIPLNGEAQACKNIRQLSTAELLAETMRRISDEESVSSLYVD